MEIHLLGLESISELMSEDRAPANEAESKLAIDAFLLIFAALEVYAAASAGCHKSLAGVGETN